MNLQASLMRKLFSPKEGLCLQSHFRRIKRIRWRIRTKGHILQRPVDKEFPPKNRLTALWIKDVSVTQKADLAGFQNFHSSDCWLTPFTSFQINVCADVTLSFFPIVSYWWVGRKGEKLSLCFLSLHTGRTTCVPNGQTLLWGDTMELQPRWYKGRAKFFFIF